MSTRAEGTTVRRTIMAVAFAATLLVVGCGGQDGDTGDSPSPPATTGAETPAY